MISKELEELLKRKDYTLVYEGYFEVSYLYGSNALTIEYYDEKDITNYMYGINCIYIFGSIEDFTKFLKGEEVSFIMIDPKYCPSNFFHVIGARYIFTSITFSNAYIVLKR
jgi:hypothetical protein